MKKMSLLVLFTAIAVSLFAQAQTGTKDAKAPSDDFTSLQTANSLARYGYSVQSASALICAAEILAQIKTQPLGSKGQSSQKGTEQVNTPEYTPANLLKDAKKFAGNDKTMLAWAADVEKSLNNTKTRGAAGGPKEGREVAYGQGTVTFNIAFRANEWAEVYVSGSGSSILDIFIYDNNGNLVARTDVNTYDAYVSWVPRWTGSYQVVVRNLGNASNRFQLFTN